MASVKRSVLAQAPWTWKRVRMAWISGKNAVTSTPLLRIPVLFSGRSMKIGTESAPEGGSMIVGGCPVPRVESESW